MDSLGRTEVFVEVAKNRSFAKAAKQMGMTGPAASKQVMALEEELGIKLLHRTTRLVTLTDEGAVYYERARLVLEELKDAAEQIQDMKATPKGLIRINAPLSFGHMHLLPALSGFAKKYPEIKMEVALEDRKIDVIAEGYDIVIRIATLNDSSLIARPLGDCPVYLVASPEYILEHGLPDSPKSLKEHRFIAFSIHGGTSEWKYRDKNGKHGSIRLEGAFKANTAEMMLQAALDGVGIALLPIFTIATHLKSKQLVRVLPAYETSPTLQINALMPPNRYRSNKIRLLADWLEHACKAMPFGK
jgi:DNA-binding transcriptional LysR family regulator